MASEDLMIKYNVPTPRYTSYPTVPMWSEESIAQDNWKSEITKTVSRENHKVNLYIHLPFCDSLCTFCGCNKRITKNHDVEGDYVDAILKEWQLYYDLFPERPIIHELHLGGGTPTFFSARNLERLIQGILDTAEVSDNNAFSFEGNPKNTTRKQLETLYKLHFRRASYGIQDFDPTVQDVINRIQDFDLVKRVVDDTREAGFEAINFDLVYGLPFQTLNSIDDTFKKVAELRPDRIAYYSYAHVPWVKGVGQRKFSDEDIPRDDEKRSLYERGRIYLSEQGYKDVGMDHFALKNDELYEALKNGNLFRNFMGYTVYRSRFQLGLGVSSISDTWTSFAQNEKILENYYARIDEGELPITKGHFLNSDDEIIRQCILDLMCRGETRIPEEVDYEEIYKRLSPMEADGLINLDKKMVKILEKGKPFIRNISMAFDLRLWKEKPQSQLFSMSI